MNNPILDGLKAFTGWGTEASSASSSSPSPDTVREWFADFAALNLDATTVVRMVLPLPPRVDVATSRFYRVVLLPLRVAEAIRAELLSAPGRELFKHVLSPLDLGHLFHSTANALSALQLGSTALPEPA
jgi:hypothetical protein